MAATEVQMAKSALAAIRVEHERMAANLAACQNLVRVKVGELKAAQAELDRMRKDREYVP
jgi:hypothetical protein